MDEQKSKEDRKTEYEGARVKVGTLGNFVFITFVIMLLGTMGLIYFLIHMEKENYDKRYNELVESIQQDAVANEPKDETTNDVKTIANILDSAISTQTDTSGVVVKDDVNTIMNEKLVVLYGGLILDTSKMDEVTLQYIDSTAKESDKYVITYYSYENYSYKDAKLGTLSAKIVGNLVKINNVGKIAISENYNAIPRDVKVINTIPDVITSDSRTNELIKSYDTLKTIIVDLDGNGTEEYILVLANKSTGYSKIVLYDTNGKKVNDLASVEKSRWKKGQNTEYYLSINNIEVVDIDNDGIMEIIVEIPHGTGDPTVSLLKYNNGKLSGKTGIECSLLSE